MGNSPKVIGNSLGGREGFLLFIYREGGISLPISSFLLFIPNPLFYLIYFFIYPYVILIVFPYSLFF